MIIGHYAIGFAASRAEPALPLWQSMIAVVWLDILHSSLVILGVERAVLVPGITAVVPIDLQHYPISHSLVAAVLWSLLAFVLVGRKHRRAGVFVALCVFSHYVLDLVAHRPDLPIVTGEPKFGFGMWHSIPITFVVENVMLFGACWLYDVARKPARKERIAIYLMCIVGSALFFTFPVTDFPADIRITEAVALVVYAVVPVVAYLTATKRRIGEGGLVL
jgi:membrane-bound metal-dependent hydrolase YbcI (DUF457 family)